MSRREGRERESETKRHHPKLDREPSPKRSRRDGKPATERTTSGNHDLDTTHRSDHDQKHRRRLQDAVPLEAPLEPESKVIPNAANGESRKKTEEPTNGPKTSSDPTKVPRAQSYFQHDERESAGQGGRGLGQKATTERGWWGDTKDRSSDKVGGKEKRDEKPHPGGDDNTVWRHDRFHELEADAPPPARRRPAFREKKVESEAGNAAAMTGRRNHSEREGRYSHDQKQLRRDWGAAPHSSRGETQRSVFSPRERFTADGPPRGRFGDRNQYRASNGRVDKWKHDLYDEANKSPSPKNEEDQIAKVEALLAS